MGEKADKKRIGQSIKIKKYDDIFDAPSNPPATADTGNEKYGKTVLLSPSVLTDFNGHPFKVSGKGINELIESIREYGILSPIIARPSKNPGFYEIISGHRRKHCAVILRLPDVPVIIRDVDDDEAILAMVDSNIQREDILPSEKALAYKMKLEAIKRQGERKDLKKAGVEDESTSGQIGQKLSGSDIIGSENNESGRQIRRYIRLTELPSLLLEAIDNKKMSLNAGVELSFLSENEKEAVCQAIAVTRKYPSLKQAVRLRSKSGKGMTVDDAKDILSDSENKKVNFNRAEIRAFFPKEYTAKQIEEVIIEMLRERAFEPR